MTDNEGLIKIDFELIDNANNVSVSKTYYVIKDVSITAILKFANWETSATSFRAISGTSETITLTPLTPTDDNNQQDVFYTAGSTKYSTNFKIDSIKYGDSKDNITRSATKSGNNFTFTYDVTQVTYLSIEYSDDVGNSKTILRAIPSKPVWSSGNCTTDGYSGIRVVTFNAQSEDLMEGIADSIGAETNLMIKSDNITDSSSDFSVNRVYFRPSKNYKCYLYHTFRFDGEDWASVSDSNKYLYVATESTITDSSSPNQFYVNGESSSSSSMSAPSGMPSVINLKVTPVLNSGLCKVYVESDLSSSYTWTYIFTTVYTPIETRVFDSRTAYLPSKSNNTTYTLKLKAKASNGATWTSGIQSVKVNGQGSSVTEFAVDYDTTPPYFPESSNMWTEPSQIYSRYKIEDGLFGLGMYTNGKGLGELTYYFIPSKTTSLDSTEEYKLDELSVYMPHTTTYEIGKSFKIPYLDMAEGQYTCYMVVKDKSGNTATQAMSVFNKLLNKSVKYEIVKEGSSFIFYATYASADEANNSRVKSYKAEPRNGTWLNASIGAQYHDPNPLVKYDPVESSGVYGVQDKWIKIITEYRTGSTVNSGYYYVDYMYPSYYFKKGEADEITCKSKNIVSGGYGFQIFCDAPTFAHVVYYPSKLTQTNKVSDIPIWETKGCEENFILSSENFTYGEDKFEYIPDGMYYAVIVHFADGSKAMSEIRQK